MNKIVKLDRITGPLTKEEFQALVSLPFGKAGEQIRKHDPFWGLAPGEKIRFKVTCRSRAWGTAYVHASSQKEADKLADELSECDVEWDDHDDDFDVESVEPDGAGV